MELLAGSYTKIVFLLVDDQMQPINVQQNMLDIVTSFDGGDFVPYAADVWTLGRGWYYVNFLAPDTPGTLVFEASAEGSQKWRDIHEVKVRQSADLAAVLRAELEQWVLEFNLPIKLIRSGAST